MSLTVLDLFLPVQQFHVHLFIKRTFLYSVNSSKTHLISFHYLNRNAADQSSAERAVKITRSLNNQTPVRITQVPYIQRKHHEIDPEVLKRESIGSLSNCEACHKTAESGTYDDDDVVIPR
jgi:hypothetical protein